MPPPDPCKHCRSCGDCQIAGLVNRLALEAFVADESFVCPEFEQESYRGLEGVYA